MCIRDRPRVVPAAQMQQASALSRMAMNAGQMGGAVVAGVCVAAFGPGWALAACGLGMVEVKGRQKMDPSANHFSSNTVEEMQKLSLIHI